MTAEATYERDQHTFVFEDVQILISHLRDDSGGISAEVETRSLKPGGGGLIHFGRFGLLQPLQQRDYVRSCEERDDSEDWGALLLRAIYQSVNRHRRGDDVVDLRKVDTTQRSRWVLHPYLEAAGPTTIYADGGQGKSFFALALAMTIASSEPICAHGVGDPLPVLYGDWETDQFPHAERFQALCVGHKIDPAKVPIFHQRFTASLDDSAPALQGRIEEQGIGAVIIDSLGMARAGEAESSHATIATFRAIRSLGVPVIIIDHVAKSHVAEKAATGRDSGPFGSRYTFTQSRNVFSLTSKPSRDGLLVLATHRKSNFGNLQPPSGYRLRLQMDDDRERLLSAEYIPVNVSTEAAFIDQLPVGPRLLKVLQGGAQSAKGLAEIVGLTEPAVRKELLAMNAGGVTRVEQMTDRRWMLADA